MDQVQYERWRQHLEAEWEAAAEQIRAGFRSQMRILDQVWMAMPRGGGSGPAVSDPPAPGGPAALPLSPPPTPPEAASSAPAPTPERRRRPAGELFERVCEALVGLPEVFDRSDLLAALDPPPKRASLYGVLQTLQDLGWIECLESGTGTKPSRYRQVDSPADDPEEG